MFIQVPDHTSLPPQYSARILVCILLVQGQTERHATVNRMNPGYSAEDKAPPHVRKVVARVQTDYFEKLHFQGCKADNINIIHLVRRVMDGLLLFLSLLYIPALSALP